MTKSNQPTIGPVLSGNDQSQSRRSTGVSSQIAVGIVLERREATNRWLDHVWRFVDAIRDPFETPDWTEIACGDGWIRYAACTLRLELFPRETDGYIENLTSSEPKVFVILRPSDGEFDVHPFHLTVCPYEAQAYLDSGEETVEGLAMIPEIRTWVSAFVDQHPVEPFVKRKQKPKTKIDDTNPFWRPAPAKRLNRGSS
jgi:hypothetical protein